MKFFGWIVGLTDAVAPAVGEVTHESCREWFQRSLFRQEWLITTEQVANNEASYRQP